MIKMVEFFHEFISKRQRRPPANKLASTIFPAIALLLGACSYPMTATEAPASASLGTEGSPAKVEVLQDPSASIVFYSPVKLNPALAEMTSAVVAQHFKVVGTTAEKSGDRNADLIAIPTLTDPDGKPLHFELMIDFVDLRNQESVSKLSVSRTFKESETQKAIPGLMVAGMIPLVNIVTLPVGADKEAQLAANDISQYTSVLMGDMARALAADQQLLAYVPSGLASEVAAEEQSGRAAEESGNLLDALQHYSSALGDLNDPYSPLDQELRERAIYVAQRTNPPPSEPEDYRRYMVLGLNTIQGASNPGDYSKALSEFRQASNAAPWMPQPYEAMGHVSRTLGDYSSAAHYFKLCLLAAPQGPDASSVRDEIYVVEEKGSEAQTNANGM
jgi:hypothetical protein